MKKKRILAMALALSAVMAFTACSSGAETPAETPGETPTENPAEGDSTLKVQFNVEVASMDPQIATDGTSFEVIAAVTEGLYSVDKDGSPIPAMVDTVEKSEDGLTYTFKLKDAVWSNGTPVTAKDFVFAWKRLVDPEVASEYAFIMGVAGVKNADAIASGELPVDDLGVKDKKFVTLFNKQDARTDNEPLHDFRADYTLNISAAKDLGLDEVKSLLEEILRENKVYIERIIPYDKAGVIQLIRKQGELVSEEYVADGIQIKAYVPMEVYGRLD